MNLKNLQTRMMTRLLSAGLVVAGFAVPHYADADLIAASQVALGNPSNAIHDTRYPTNYLITRNQYSLAYSRYDGLTKWVSWHLNVGDFGSSGRGNYQTDTTLPAGWYEVTPDSGWSSVPSPFGPYDRGHMCPSADRTITVADNQQLFLMTNLIPQSPNNNQGTWGNLEDYTRGLVTAGSECYIICGPRGYENRITSGHVTAPAYTWKIIVVLSDNNDSNPANDISRINANTRVIAVDMPNVNGLSTDWRSYRVSVASIEQKTGLHFFTNVPTAIANQLKTKVDNQ